MKPSWPFAAVVLFSLVSLVLSIRDRESFVIFEVLAKLVTASAMYLSFRSFKWDVVKGLMGSVLFALMYQEAHLVLNVLWAEERTLIHIWWRASTAASIWRLPEWRFS